jgi:hypothetical protein
MIPRAGEVLRLLTPNVLLPAQVASPWADRWLRRLCRAILADALACLDGKGTPGNMGSDRDGARRAGQAWEWFRSDATYLFSFTTVCAVLDLEVEAVRKQVRHRAITERKAEQCPRPHSEQLPAPQESDAPPTVRNVDEQRLGAM